MEKFKAKIIEKNGKKQLIVFANSVTTTHSNGRKDVVVKVPSLGLITDFAKKQGVK